jgi:excisionase family DNA binding protein
MSRFGRAMARRGRPVYQAAMARDPDQPRPTRYQPQTPEDSALLHAELRRRGLSEDEIEAALRKKKRRKVIAFNVVKSRRALPPERLEGLRPAPGELRTVDDAADLLKLHPKTVLRFIREGRLKATRIGKSYRILKGDLDAFAGVPANDPAAAEARVTSIVDVPDVGPELAKTWARTVTNALTSRPRGAAPFSADVTYDAERAALKIVVVGGADDSVNLLSLIRLWLEQLRA